MTAAPVRRLTRRRPALVRAIARRHDGEVRVRSEPGAGARFDLVLPVPAAASGHRAITGPAQAADPFRDMKLP